MFFGGDSEHVAGGAASKYYGRFRSEAENANTTKRNNPGWWKRNSKKKAEIVPGTQGKSTKQFATHGTTREGIGY